MLNKLKVSRRSLLKGTVSGISVSLWLPVLEAMCNEGGDAFAQGAPLPTSFGVFFWGNGVHSKSWTPSAVGAGSAWHLPPHLTPFAPVKDAVTLVSGLKMLDGGFKGHGAGALYVLAGGDGQSATTIKDLDSHPGVKFEDADSTQYVPTLDQVVADAIGGSSPFASLQTGILPYRGKDMGTVSHTLSHRGPYDLLPPERDPVALFNRLFGANSAQPGSSPPKSTAIVIDSVLRKSVLDAVLEDSKRLRRSLGATDSARLDRHMESVRALEQRISVMVPTATETMPPRCARPDAPRSESGVTARSQSMNRLLALALSCNLTRVFSHLWSGARDDNTYPQAMIAEDHHELTHSGDSGNARASQIERYIMEQYADMALAMQETPMASGTVLDHTLIYGVTEVANPASHLHNDYHVLLLGRAGGRLKGNLHHRPVGAKVTELCLTLLQTMGVDRQTWGSWDATSRVMSEILT